MEILENRAREKPININILGRMVSGTNGTPPWDKLGPVPGPNRPFPVYFHTKTSILSRLSLGWVGVRPWDDCPARAVRKMFTCFLFIGFFPPPQEKCTFAFYNVPSLHTNPFVNLRLWHASSHVTLCDLSALQSQTATPSQ